MAQPKAATTRWRESRLTKNLTKSLAIGQSNKTAEEMALLRQERRGWLPTSLGTIKKRNPLDAQVSREYLC
jgi:hypothetical protein